MCKFITSAILLFCFVISSAVSAVGNKSSNLWLVTPAEYDLLQSWTEENCSEITAETRLEDITCLVPEVEKVTLRELHVQKIRRQASELNDSVRKILEVVRHSNQVMLQAMAAQ